MSLNKSDLIKLVNKNFNIQITSGGLYRNFLTGAGQYHKHLNSSKLAERHFKKALESKEDKVTFKLRRGLTINFYTK
jgi:hypothetical protein